MIINFYLMIIFYFFIVPLSIIRKVTHNKDIVSWEGNNKKSKEYFIKTKLVNDNSLKKLKIKKIKEVKGDTNPENYTFW